MSPTFSKGSWSGFDCWQLYENLYSSGPICSLPRATLKSEFLYRFWKLVSPISLEYKDYQGLIFSQGLGELPLVEQATFTVWENVFAMEAFARKTFYGGLFAKFTDSMVSKSRCLPAFYLGIRRENGKVKIPCLLLTLLQMILFFLPLFED